MNERADFVCLHGKVSQIVFGLDLISDIEDDLGVEIKVILVVAATALAAIRSVR